MRWTLIPKAGNLDRLTLVDYNSDAPKYNEVKINVKAIGLNFADIFAIFGLYSATPDGPFTPGLEFSGVVKEVGPEVKEFKPGDAVMGATRFGGYTTQITIEQHYIRPLPEGWTYEEGAAFIVQGLTAYYGLKYLGRLEAGENVLIQSAAGGVGILANRIAKKFGARTIGAVGSEAKIPLLQEEGFDQFIIRDRKFKKHLSEIVNHHPLDVVMECIGGKVLKASFDLLAPEGRLITYGSARFAQPGKRPNYLKMIWPYITRPRIDPQKMIEKNKAILGFNLIWLYHKQEKLNRLLTELIDLDVGPQKVGHTFEFRDIKNAIQLFQTGKTTGKVVVTVNE